MRRRFQTVNDAASVTFDGLSGSSHDYMRQIIQASAGEGRRCHECRLHLKTQRGISDSQNPGGDWEGGPSKAIVRSNLPEQAPIDLLLLCFW